METIGGGVLCDFVFRFFSPRLERGPHLGLGGAVFRLAREIFELERIGFNVVQFRGRPRGNEGIALGGRQLPFRFQLLHDSVRGTSHGIGRWAGR